MKKDNYFSEIMNRFRTHLNLKNEAAVADRLGISRANYSDRKQRDSIPYEHIINVCKEENISTDIIFYGQKIYEENYSERLRDIIYTLSEEETKYFYHLIESELAKKKL